MDTYNIPSTQTTDLLQDNPLKHRQIDTETLAGIVKTRMCELGFEYQFDGRTLEVRLQHNRKFVVLLPVRSMLYLKRMLFRLPWYVDAVNSVPAEFRVMSRIRTGASANAVDTVDNPSGKWKTNGIPFEMTVEELIIRLPKNRELVLKQSLTMAEAAQMFDVLPKYIEAINNVPCNFRIRPALSCDKWEKEEE